MAEHGVPDSRLTVLKRCEDHIQKNGRRKIQWLCQCSCENKTLVKVVGGSLRSGRTKSCGCLMKETSAKIGKESHKTNSYDLTGEYGIGYTSKGDEFWFDLEDKHLVEKYCWSYDKNGYVRAWDYINCKNIYLHALVMGFPSGDITIDHKNHPPRSEHKKDNRKCNLEVVTRSENNMNRSLASNNTSGITGVSFDRTRNKWMAYIKINKKTIYLGRFTRKEDAIETRKNAEIQYFGERRYAANN